MAKEFEARWLGHRTKALACRGLKKSYKSFSSGLQDRAGAERMLGMAHDLKCSWQRPVIKKLSKAQRSRIVDPISFGPPIR